MDKNNPLTPFEKGETFEQIINLIQNTGDTLVVFDEKKRAYVIMNFRDYQKFVLDHRGNLRRSSTSMPLTGLTESELLDKINKEINLWKASQENKTLETELTEKDN